MLEVLGKNFYELPNIINLTLGTSIKEIHIFFHVMHSKPNRFGTFETSCCGSNCDTFAL